MLEKSIKAVMVGVVMIGLMLGPASLQLRAAADPEAGGKMPITSPGAMDRFEEADLTRPGSFGGDDDYDPAAGGTPALSVVAASERSALAAARSFSGGALCR